MTQAELLLDPTGAEIRDRHSHGPVGGAVRGFFVRRWRLGGGWPREFNASDLYIHVSPTVPVAPDTPARIMRLMREEGELDYEVVNRAKSLYRILGVRLESGEVLGRIRL